MADFNPDEFLGSAAASPPASSAPVAAAPANFDPDKFLNDGQATDKLTGEKIPLPLSGNTPETAMNKSPLSAQDRMALSLGNLPGNLKYLKDRYADAKPIMGDDGKPSKDVAVRDGNTWYRVNPINGDIQDPWERTKEYLKDAATFAPEALGMGVAAGTDILTGGASIPASAALAGGVAAGVRTSLGRVVGTYDATPAEQAWDIGFESILNAAGAKVLAGVKPTAKYIGNKLPEIAEAFKDTVEPWIPTVAKSAGGAAADAASSVMNTPKAIMKKVLAGFSVGENNFDTMVENPERVRGLMRNLHDMAGGDINAYHDEALRTQLGSIQKIADGARSAASQIYGSMRNKILAVVPSDFSANLDEPVYAAYQKAVQNGLGTMAVAGKELSSREAIDHLAAKGINGAEFRLFSQDELANAAKRGAALGNGTGALIADKEAYGILSDYYSNLSKFTGGQNRTGTEGARSLMDFKKVAGDLSYKMANTDAAQSTPALKALIDEGKVAMDDAVYQGLKKHGAGDAYLNLNNTYSNIMQKFQPLLQAQKQFTKTDNPKVYEGLLNTFLARPGKNASARFAIDDVIQAADANGLKALSQNLIDEKRGIQVAEAAKAFNPLRSGVLKADAIGAGQAMMGTYALKTQDPTLLAAMVGMHALRSPTTPSLAIAATQGMAKGQQMLASFSKTQADKFLSSPEAINAFTTGMVQAPLVRAQAEEKIKAAFQAKMEQQAQLKQQIQEQQQQAAQQGK